MVVSFELDGRRFTALNGRSAPGFTDAVSFMVDCPDQAAIDRPWDALTEGGAPCQWWPG
jgi:predicted 3-demethylubiquinone-9 3-methyltransferase (glyoxalase superfamily)